MGKKSERSVFTDNPSKLRSRIRALQMQANQLAIALDKERKQSVAYVGVLQDELGIEHNESVLVGIGRLKLINSQQDQTIQDLQEILAQKEELIRFAATASIEEVAQWRNKYFTEALAELEARNEVPPMASE